MKREWKIIKPKQYNGYITRLEFKIDYVVKVTEVMSSYNSADFNKYIDIMMDDLLFREKIIKPSGKRRLEIYEEFLDHD